MNYSPVPLPKAGGALFPPHFARRVLAAVGPANS